MPENKMRNKEEVLKGTSYSGVLEALLDIRDILDERMSKGIGISGVGEEKGEEDLEKSLTHSRPRPTTKPPTQRQRPIK